ncbi:hypothetical protein E2C01_014834 [Portunus trituberculatus]|uniref:Uncharacterized protein n=1 Tax=Portunus trituberculatus TaxID=210409 RepID=A0A5B7DLC2_PORTR|nr:hypothetical protein [Portunus trituberculatus]
MYSIILLEEPQLEFEKHVVMPSKSHHNLTLFIHHLISQQHNIHLQWMPSHVGVMGNTVTDRAAAEAHTHPSPIDLATDQTEFLTDL